MSESEPTRLANDRRHAPHERRGVGHAAVERARLADDAEGRVELLVVRAPADVLEPAEPPAPAPAPAARPASRVAAEVMRFDGWIAVSILALALIGIFIVGLWLTH